MGDFPLNGLGDFTNKAMTDLDDGLFYGTATAQSQPLDNQHLTQNSNRPFFDILILICFSFLILTLKVLNATIVNMAVVKSCI